MVKFEHERLLKKLTALSTRPEEEDKFNEWITNVSQLQILIDNLNSDEYIASVLSRYLYVQTAIVPREQLTNPDINNLLSWGIGSTGHRISQLTTFEPDNKPELVENNFLGCDSITKSQSLVFNRTFEGVTDENRDYYELLQEFSHISGIHWRDEHSAYCKFNKYGKMIEIASISKSPINLVTVNRKILDNYLYLSNSAIIRVFDCTLFCAGFNSWKQNDEKIIHLKNTYFKQCIEPSNGSYTRGFQIINTKDSDEDINKRVSSFNDDDGSDADETPQYIEFIAYDWRNKASRDISTDPSKTTNYFQAQKNRLPYETSPAFFRPDVILKYKKDKDKYTISTRRIECRESWEVKSYDINEAGQIHVYICYLRSLPYEEQLYWRSFNEKPKSCISQRAYIQDFEGGWDAEVDPLDKVRHTLQNWCDFDVSWWKPKNDNVFKNATAPITDSKDEWADSFMELSQLVIEGLEPNKIKDALKHFDINYEKGNGGIKLLKLLCAPSIPELSALGEIQMVRNFKGHAKESESEAYSKKVIKEYGGYHQHFNAVCDRLLIELDIIENKFKEIQ